MPHLESWFFENCRNRNFLLLRFIHNKSFNAQGKMSKNLSFYLKSQFFAYGKKAFKAAAGQKT